MSSFSPRFRRAAWLLFAAYVGFAVWTQWQGFRDAEAGRTPHFSDYNSLYAAAVMIREGRAADIYLPKEMHAANVRVANAAYGGRLDEAQKRRVGFSPWLYPPLFITVALPLAFLSYFPALLLWLTATAGVFLAAVRLQLRTAADLGVALAAPPVFYNIMYGQTGFLSAGLIGGGLALLQRQPALAGVLIGLAACKPHLGVLLPLALVCGGHWKPFGTATITVVATVALSGFLFGLDPWLGYIGTLQFSFDGLASSGYEWRAMASLLGAARMAGIDLDTAWLAQYLGIGVGVAAVVWAWYERPATPEVLRLQAAIVCLATFLVTPMAYFYDLVIVVPAALWLLRDLDECRAGAAERRIFWINIAGLILARPAAIHAGFGVATVAVAVLLGLAAWRLHCRLQSFEAPAATPAGPQN